MALSLDFLLAVGLGHPLLFQHGALDGKVGLVRFLNGLLGSLLPVEDSKRVGVKLCLLLGLSDFTLKFLLGVKRVELSVNLLLEHALLNLTALVN